MTTIHWHEIPFVRICIPFMIGILVQQQVDGHLIPMISLVLTLIIASISLVIRSQHRRQQVRTVLISLLMVAIGASIRYAAEPSFDEIVQLAAKDRIHAAIVQSVVRTDYGVKAKLKLIPPSTRETNIRIIGYLRDSTYSLWPGDTLVFQKTLELIPPPSNPYAFDIARFYRHQGIYLRAYVDHSEIRDFRTYQGSPHLVRKSAQIRAQIQRIFEQYITNTQSCAVLLAMTVGIVEGLSDDIYDAYAKTGTIHVLSISGLHVGIISVLLFLLVGRVRPADTIGKKVLRILVLLAGIWGFACIAGLSPPIVRAAFMFSVYLAGVCLRRPTRGLNVMAFTAFVCLVFDPLQINALSFQFSYLSLCGLLIFFKPLYGLFAVKSFVSRFVWGTIVMSVAAQILLLPLLVHYFKQISLISLLSSLVAVPASYGILVGGILLLILHMLLPAIAGMAGQVISGFVEIVNRAIIGMSSLPLSHLSNVYLPPVSIALLSGVTVLIALRVLTRNRIYTYAMIPVMLMFGALYLRSIYQSMHYNRLAIYPGVKHIAIDYVSGMRCYTTFDDTIMSKYRAQEVNEFRVRSHARGAERQFFAPDSIPAIQILELPGVTGHEYEPEYKRIAIITEKTELDTALLRALNADWIVMSEALDYFTRRRYAQFFHQHDQLFHDLKEQGTFYLTHLKNRQTHEKQRQDFNG